MDLKTMKALVVMLLLTMTVAFTGDVGAHAPASMSLSYSMDEQVLNVTIEHNIAGVLDHYIETVEVYRNSELVLVENYTSQPANVFSHMYNITAEEGDWLNVTATCNLAGSYNESLLIIGPDTTPPTINIISPQDGAVLSTSTVTISGNASDDIELNRVEVSVNNGSTVIASGTEEWSTPVNLDVGLNIIEATAYDEAGNNASTSINVTYDPESIPDTTPPVIHITSPSDGDSLTPPADITIRGTATDNVAVSRVEVRINDGGWLIASGTSSWSRIVTLAEGQNVIDARAFDDAGNSAINSITVSFSTAILEPTMDGVITDGEYTNRAVFAEGKFELYWKFEGGNFRMAMRAETTGWVSIGFDPSVRMKDADIILGWVDEDGPHIIDAFSIGETGPHPEDTAIGGTMDILEYGGSQTATHTTIEFVRALDTGDNRDKPFPTSGEITVIWAYGYANDPSSSHSERGIALIDVQSGLISEEKGFFMEPMHWALALVGIIIIAVAIGVTRRRKKKNVPPRAHVQAIPRKPGQM